MQVQNSVSNESQHPTEKDEHKSGTQYVRDLILGFNDALVSVFAIVAGVFGAGLASQDILITGIAAALAGALSMAIGEYLSTKSQEEVYQAERKVEKEHLKIYPEHEKQELREMYQKKGFEGEILEKIVEVISSDPDVFLEVMMVEEFGVLKAERRLPYIAMLLVFFAFLIGSIAPVLPFALISGNAEVATLVALTLSSIGLFAVGAGKIYFTRGSIIKSGTENMVMGLFAAAITFTIGLAIGTTL